MAMRFVFDIFALLLLFLCVVVDVNGIGFPPKFFDVRNYGAVADGRTDNAQAFLRAWKDACAYRGRSRLYVPMGTFLLGSVSFVGKCHGSMSFIIRGTLKAPTDGRNLYSDTWIGFRYVDNLKVKGGGTLDGQGQFAWRYNDCNKNSNCRPLPVTMRFDFVTNSVVRNIRSINSKNSHFNVFACENMNISRIRLSAPAESPNTDGIHIGMSRNIKISDSFIGTGDDCVSMVSGSQSIDIFNVVCGPGHGISIGSLGRSHEHEYVNDISVRNCTFVNTDNGVRIKTWSPSSYSKASDITFQDIVMEYVRNPIFIDQRYCPFANCLVQGESNSAVQIQDVTFKNIYGISSSEVAVNIQCSRALPCKNVKLMNINLSYNGRGGRAKSTCANVIGSSYGVLVPSGCV